MNDKFETIERYRTREKKAHDELLRRKGIKAKLYQATTERCLTHSLDPTQQPIVKLDHEYSINENDKENYIDIRIFIIQREDKFHEIGMHTEDHEALRTDYVAYLSGDEVYKIGDTVEFLYHKMIIHKVFKHREYSSVYRYLLGKGFKSE